MTDEQRLDSDSTVERSDREDDAFPVDPAGQADDQLEDAEYEFSLSPEDMKLKVPPAPQGSPADLEILARYWAKEAVRCDYYSRTGHVSSAKRSTIAYMKLNQIVDAVGKDTIEKMLEEVAENERRKAGDRNWRLAMHGSELEMEAISYDADRALPITLDRARPYWAVREMAKKAVELLPEMRADNLALVLHTAAHHVTEIKVESPDCSHQWQPAKLPNAGDTVERCDDCGALRDNHPFDDEVLEYARQMVESCDN